VGVLLISSSGFLPVTRATQAMAAASSFTSIRARFMLGGIGKTSVARAAVYQMAEQDWADILWISARQYGLDQRGRMQPVANAVHTFDDMVMRLAEQLGQTHLAGLDTAVKLQRLQPILKDKPHLIVIDNLETAEDVDILIPRLEPLANPTRFLLTSRHTMSRFPFIHILPVTDLSLADGCLLIQSELTRRGKSANLPPQDMGAIYRIVGGLPLALKLVAAQMSRLPLDWVLAQLWQAGQEDPYTYIYRQSWEMLTEPARFLLLDIMDIGPDGETWEWLHLMTDLDGAKLQTAVDELIDASLLEASHLSDAKLYRLHRLTITFLQTDILGGWFDDEDGMGMEEE
ncbi:MAG: hypothetical protein GWP17_02210, partial [Aquificales bacterium]|nr:hypothetical protein [Aquificales bacterium]